MTTYSEVHKMKSRSLAGNCAIAVFLVALVCVAVAFCTSSWLVSDYRITGAKFNRLGLWTHCFRSLPDPTDVSAGRYFVGCRWVYDPFTMGYDRIRGYLLPGFMISTQFFFTLCLLSCLLGAIMVLMYFLCCGPDQEKFLFLIRLIGYIMLAGGSCGCLGIIIFACLGNSDRWMPDHANNFLGWSFGLGVVGALTCLIAGALFLTEANIQMKKRKQMKESQSRFELEQESRA